MRHLLAFVLLCAAAFAQKAPIVFQNVATARQTAWVFVGLPAGHMADTQKAGYLTDGETVKWPYVREPGGMRALVSLAGGQMLSVRDAGFAAEPEPFAFHPAISRDVLAVAPRFFLGAEAAPAPALSLVRASMASQVWLIRAHWPVRKVTVDCWCTVTSGHPAIEFAVHATYGTTANDGQAQVVVLPQLRMESAARPCPDFYQRNGLPIATWNPGPRWVLPLVDEGTRWHRASRFETRGVILAMPDEVREQARPMQGLYTGWDGSWMALGRVPVSTPDVPALRRQQKQSYTSPAWGTYAQSRPRAQMQTSGTTGEQPDFGWASDLAVVTNEPWEIHDALWQCQAFSQRPTGNREPGGAPMRASLHPKAETLNQRPDLSWGLEDRLGWPGQNQIGWIPAFETVLWSTSDDQHRADNLLHATIALTRDPALEAIVADHIELDKTDFYVRRSLPPSPRAVGRLALTRANQKWLGFDSVATLRSSLDAAIVKFPAGPEPAIEEAKYGWSLADGSSVVYGWQPWQKTIEAGGFLAAGRVLNEPRYKQAAFVIAQTCATRGFRLVEGRWWHAYALRWQPDPPRWPATLNRDGEGFTDDVYVSSAAASWTIGAAILAGGEAKAVVEWMGPPRNISEARWRAIR